MISIDVHYVKSIKARQGHGQEAHWVVLEIETCTGNMRKVEIALFTNNVEGQDAKGYATRIANAINSIDQEEPKFEPNEKLAVLTREMLRDDLRKAMKEPPCSE